jgi:hypothetical protein
LPFESAQGAPIAAQGFAKTLMNRAAPFLPKSCAGVVFLPETHPSRLHRLRAALFRCPVKRVILPPRCPQTLAGRRCVDLPERRGRWQQTI